MTDYLYQTLDFDSKNAPSVFDELSFWSSHFGQLLLDKLELRPNLRVLDLACGTGFPLFELAERHGLSSRFVGADINPAGLERASLKRHVHGSKNVDLARVDGAALPFASSVFDLIVSNLGVNNFPDAGQVFVQCARVAKAGARLVLTSNVQGHMAEFYAVYRQTLQDLGLADKLENMRANEEHRLSPKVISGLLEKAGFKVITSVVEPFTMRFLDGSALFRHFLVRLGFLDGWRGVAGPENEDRVFSALETNLNRVAAEQGELRLTIPRLYLEAQRV